MQRLRHLLVPLFLLVILLVACGRAPTATPSDGPDVKLAAGEQLQVAFVYNTPISDLGWSWGHDQGRAAIQEAFGQQINVSFMESVPEAEAVQTLRTLAREGNHLIFVPTNALASAVIEVAPEFPNTWFITTNGPTALNVSTAFGRMEIPRYLSGIVAGAATESNVIGYVAAFDTPEVVRGINAFTLGVRSVNSEAEVRVLYTDTWFDPMLERAAAERLLGEGADILAQHQDSIEPQEAARDANVLSIGYHSDMSRFVGETVLTSPSWSWEEKYTEIVRQVLEGSYQSEAYYSADVVKLAPFSSLVASETVKMVEAQDVAIRAGAADVFCGPIRSNTDVLVVAEGNCLTDAELLSMDWYVEGVVAEAPAEAREGLGEASSKVPAWKSSE